MDQVKTRVPSLSSVHDDYCVDMSNALKVAVAVAVFFPVWT